MKVKELISSLKGFDENEEIVFCNVIESGRGCFSGSCDGELDMIVVNDYEYVDCDGEDVSLGKRLVVRVSGEEDWNE